jgi:hypothetical protein
MKSGIQVSHTREGNMTPSRRLPTIVTLSVACALFNTPPVHAEKVYDPAPGSCVEDGHGGSNNASHLRAGSLRQAPQQCDATRFFYDSFPLPHLNQDIDLLLSGYYFSTGYPYMNNARINTYLMSLDADSANEFHKLWRDFQLNFNYFKGANPTGYYQTFGAGNPNMHFDLQGMPDNEERHVDIYLLHPNDGVGGGHYPSVVSDPQEDGSPTSCADDYPLNSISLGAGFKSTVGTCGYISSEDPNWHLSGERVSVVTQHEFQHLLFASRGGSSAPGFPNEMFSMAAEYLVDASLRDDQRATDNLKYDLGLVNTVTPGGGFDSDHYANWYLWGIYLSQQFAADTMQVEDDLLYKWVRNRNEFGFYDQEMHGLAHVLEAPEYANLGGSTGAERLRNLYHNYVLAKWINNPSPSFYGGRLGFTRGVVPSVTPGFFDNTFLPFAKETALEVPPRFLVGQEVAGYDSIYAIGGLWRTTDTNCGVQQTSKDTIGIWLYGSDYIQFDAGSHFRTNGKQNTLAFKMFWDPAQYPGSGSQNSVRVAAISYSASTGDSLYLKGSTATGITYAYVDSLHGFAQVWVPNFGGATKSVVIAIDMGEVSPASGGRNPRKLYYGYSFRVDESTPPASRPLGLTVTRSTGQTYTALQWSDPGACGSSGYTIQRSTSTLGSFATVATVPVGIFARNDTTGATPLTFYRVFATGAPACSSNVATTGGITSISQSLGGALYLAGDLVMTGTHTLTILPGTTVRCAPNYDSQQSGYDPSRVEIRVVSGAQIQAVGTPLDSIRWTSAAVNPAPGDWRGLYLQLTDASPSRFEYNAITHAVHGIQMEYNTSPKIDHCSIRHSQLYGIWAFNSCSPTIINSILEQNHGAEVAITGSSNATVRNCFLRYSPGLGSGAVDDGIVYTVNSGGIFRRNRVAGVGMGMYCLNSSSPTLVGQGPDIDSLLYGRNDILDFRYYGVRTGDEGLPELGLTNQSGSYLAGHNNLFSSAFPTALWIYHSSSINQLSARHDFWGSANPDLTRFSGNIAGPSQSSLRLNAFDSPSGPSRYYPGYQGAAPLNTAEQLYDEALALELRGNIDDAVSSYRSVMTDYSDDALAGAAYTRLVNVQLSRNRAADEIIASRSISPPSNSSLERAMRRLRPSLLASAGEWGQATSAYEELVADPSFDRAGILLELALQKGLSQRDIAGARDAVTRMQEASQDYHLIKHARAMLQGIVGDDIWLTIPEPSVGSALSESSVSLMSLEQNYPNPSNPRTTIAFNLPSADHIRLQVFDVHGRLVKTLADADFPVGRHEVTWDGQNNTGGIVGSGVYYFRLQATGRSISRKLMMLK